MTQATLIWADRTKDKDGFPVETKHTAEIFAEEKSITRAEFYESMRSGMEVTLVLEARQEDFALSGHEKAGHLLYAGKLMYAGQEYTIIRTYKKKKSKIELVCR